MMTLRRTLLLLFPLLLISACSESPSDSGQAALSSGSYAYRAWNDQGQEVASGVLELSRHSSEANTNIQGHWEIQALTADSSEIGPQIGTGELVGHLTADEVFIQLNPNYADNNVGLFGQVEKNNTLTGRWEYSGFAGPLSGGQFQAVCSRNCQPS